MSKTPGVGQAYLGAYRDNEGRAFDGAQSYRLHVSPNPPAKQFWSMTLYDVDTRALIQNKEQIADRNSRQPELVRNADGSVDLYFGPAPPRGSKKTQIPCPLGACVTCFERHCSPPSPSVVLGPLPGGLR